VLTYLVFFLSFQEMKFIQRRFLQGGASYINNNAGASFPLPGMSLQYPGMSIAYPGMSIAYPGMSIAYPGMSIPYSGMSLPYYPGMSLSHGSSHSHSPTITQPPHMAPTDLSTGATKVADATADCVGRDLAASTQIHVQLDVDSSVTGTSFVDNLAQSIASFGDAHFSLCQNSGNGRLLLVSTSSHRDQNNVTVTGLDTTASAADKVCTPAEQGSYCTVVDVVLTVYSASEESTSAAEQQVYDEVLVKQLEAGTVSIQRTMTLLIRLQ
jgi:hypothetical protein